MRCEWKTYQVGDLCSSISETYKGKDEYVVLINTSDVSEGKILNHSLTKNANLKGQFKKKFRTKDILYSEIRPANKRFAFVDIEDTQNYIASTKLMVIRANAEIIIPEYLFVFLQMPTIIAELQMLAETRSGTFPQITFSSEISPLSISLPNKGTQNRIVEIFRSLDDKIELNNKINENLEQQATAIFKSWFVDYIPFDGTAPKEWSDVILDDITSLVTRGIAPKYSDDSDQTVINQKCIRNHMIDLSLARKHTPKTINEKWLQYGDLLINSTGTGTLGRTAQVWFKPKNLTVDSHVTIVRPAKENLIFYIGLWGISHEKEIESLHTGSTGQTELPRDRVKTMELLLPDDVALNRFHSIIAPLAASIISNQEENLKLAELRDILLPKLMSGELI